MGLDDLKSKVVEVVLMPMRFVILLGTKLMLMDKGKRLLFFKVCSGVMIIITVLAIITMNFIADIEVFLLMLMVGVFILGYILTKKEDEEELEEYKFKEGVGVKFHFRQDTINEEQKERYKQELEKDVVLDDWDLTEEIKEEKDVVLDDWDLTEEIKEEREEIEEEESVIDDILSETLDGILDEDLTLEVEQYKEEIIESLQKNIPKEVKERAEEIKKQTKEEILENSNLTESLMVELDDLNIGGFDLSGNMVAFSIMDM